MNGLLTPNMLTSSKSTVLSSLMRALRTHLRRGKPS